VTEEGTALQVKRGDLITLAEKEAEKAAAKNTPEAQKEAEEKETARIEAAAAKEDAALRSADFYKEQYSALVALVNNAPEEMTPAEFAQTVNDNLRVAYESLNAEEAKLVNPLPPPYPSFKGTKGMNNLIAFLSADAVGRPSPLKQVFGLGSNDEIVDRVTKFAHCILETFLVKEAVAQVNISLFDESGHIIPSKEAKKALAATAKSQEAIAAADATKYPAAEPDTDVVSTTKVGDKSEPTPHGFYYEFIKDEKPYAVRDANNPHLGIMCKFKGKTEAERYINDREREAAEAMAAAANGTDVPQGCEKDYAEDEVAAMFTAKGPN
jgi:hypothetical protein